MTIKRQAEQREIEIKVVHVNVRSILKNKDNLESFLHNLNFAPDVLVCTETWLKATRAHMATLEGYKSVHVTAKLNKSDGVTFFVREGLQFQIVNNNFSGCTGKSIIVLIGDKKVFITGMYRSPKYRQIDSFLEGLDDLMKDHSCAAHVIIGDMNVDLLENSTRTNELLNLVSSNGFINYIREPTRINITGGRETCDDHVYAKCMNSKVNVKAVVLNGAFTDHRPLLVECKLITSIDNLGENWKSPKIIYNNELIAQMLSGYNWKKFLKFTKVDDAMAELLLIINTCMEKHEKKIVKPTHRDKRLKPWMTAALLKSMRIRDQLYRAWAKDKQNERLKNNYITYRNKIVQLIRLSKNRHYIKIMKECQNNPRETWRLINKLGGRTAEASETSAGITSEKLNDYFSTIGESLVTKLERSNVIQKESIVDGVRNPGSLFFKPTSTAEIDRVIKDLKSTMACGVDSISINLLKMSAASLAGPIAHIINLVFTTGIFPSQLKEAIVTPIYKKNGCKSAPENYRPISVLSNLGKIIEKVIKTRLVDYLTNKNIISENQFGFVSGRNTSQAAAHLVTSIVDKLEKGKKCLGVFLDMTKAFDSVSHKLLLTKLEKIGIRGVALEIFRTYLCGRTQRVRYGSLSGPRRVGFGVPQGSVLGPILFIIYINGICQLNLRYAYVSAFADDVAIIFWEETWEALEMHVNNTLNTVITPWLSSNLITLNTLKTVCVPFFTCKGTKVRPTIKLKIHEADCKKECCNCELLKVDDVVKYLGLKIDSFLSWDKHVEYLVKKLRGVIATISHLKRFLNLDTLKMVYMALFQSNAAYGIGIYGGASGRIIGEIEKLQRYVIKVILRLPRRYPSQELCSLFNVLSIEQLHELDLIRLFSSFWNHIKLKKRDGRLRNSHERVAIRPKCHLVLSEQTPLYKIISLYNRMPEDLKIILQFRFSTLNPVLKEAIINWVKR